APYAERALHGLVGRAEEHGLGVRLDDRVLPARHGPDVAWTELEAARRVGLADRHVTATFDGDVNRAGRARIRRGRETRGQPLEERRDRRNRGPAGCGVDVLELDPVTGIERPVSREPGERLAGAGVSVAEHGR